MTFPVSILAEDISDRVRSDPTRVIVAIVLGLIAVTIINPDWRRKAIDFVNVVWHNGMLRMVAIVLVVAIMCWTDVMMPAGSIRAQDIRERVLADPMRCIFAIAIGLIMMTMINSHCRRKAINFVRVVWHNPVSQFILIVAVAYEAIPFMTADIPSIVNDLNAQPWACFLPWKLWGVQLYTYSPQFRLVPHTIYRPDFRWVPNDANQMKIANHGGIDAIIKNLVKYPDHARVQQSGCLALWRLVVAHRDNNRKEIAKQGGIDAIIKALGKHPDHAGVQHNCGMTLKNLADEADIKQEIIEKGGGNCLIPE